MHSFAQKCENVLFTCYRVFVIMLLAPHTPLDISGYTKEEIVARKRVVTARKWLPGEARSILHKSAGAPQIKGRLDITKRFPLFATATDDEIFEAIDRMGYITVRKVEKMLKIMRGISQPKVRAKRPRDVFDEEEDQIKQGIVRGQMVKRLIAMAEERLAKDSER